MISASGRRDVIDESYNRYTFNDPDLPEWFTTDESRHNKPSLPVTREAVDLMKQKMKAMDARPIRKVAEAKFRKQLRTQRRIEKAKAKGEGMTNDEDVPESSKMEAIQKLMAKAKNPKKTAKEKPTVVVARGFNKANKGRPRGVKGRYKVHSTNIDG
jgi:AdoMet-dependent rRNA methyltransferase SPB1